MDLQLPPVGLDQLAESVGITRLRPLDQLGAHLPTLASFPGPGHPRRAAIERRHRSAATLDGHGLPSPVPGRCLPRRRLKDAT
jgi:hypothetical protein